MRKFICSILTVLMILTMVPNLGFAVSLDDGFYSPSLSIKNQELPSIDPDRTKTITFNIMNSGNRAEDLVITPNFEGTPFSSNTLNSSISVGDIQGNSNKSVNLEIKAASNAKAGNYQIPLNLEYKYVSSKDDSYTTKRVSDKEIRITVRVSGRTSQPQLIVSKVSTNPEEITPGKEIKLSILFENKGSIDAENVKIRLNGLDNDKGLYISSGSDLAYLKKVPGNMVSAVSFNIRTGKNVKSGIQALEVEFEHEEKKEIQTIYLNVKAGGSIESKLSIENLQYPKGAISANRDFVMKFDLKNNSELKASNIIVKAESTDIESVVPKSVGIKKLNNLEPGASASFIFVFSPTEDASTRSYPIELNISYEDEFNEGEGNEVTLNQYVAINAYNSDKKSTPKLIIDKFSFDPKLVKAGEEFTMTLSFFNTNSTRSVRNIKIFLTSDDIVDSNSSTAGGSVFTPVNTSNTFYIDSISPKGRVEKRITMFTVPDAKAKTYTMTATFEYEDSEAEEFKAIELIGVPVVQQSKLDIGELEYMSEAYIGEATPISLEFYNTGKVSLSNMMVKLEGNFQTENAQFYLGNFESGNSEFFEGYVIPTEPGELKGNVVFTFEDSTGEEQVIKKEFTLNVMDMPPMDENFPMEDMDQGSKSFFKSPIFWIILIAAAAGTGIFLKKRKAKKEEELSLNE